VVRGLGYNLSSADLRLGAVRKTPTGFVVLGTRLVRDCDPIEQGRFLLNVRRDGAVDTLAQDVIERSPGYIVE
jgi:hypothetical protein